MKNNINWDHKQNFKIFNEIFISEIFFIDKDKNWVIQIIPYKNQLKNLNIEWSDNNFQNRINIINNKEKIIFRQKACLSMGFTNKYNEIEFYSLMTTSRKRENSTKQYAFYKNKEEKIIYVNLSPIKIFKISENDKCEINKNKNKNFYFDGELGFGKEIINKMKKSDVKYLFKKTNLNVYRMFV